MEATSEPLATRRLRRAAPDVPSWLIRLSSWSWRLLVVALAVVGLAIAAAQLRFVLLPLGTGLLLSTILVPPARALTSRGMRPLLATWIVFLGFVGIVAGGGVLVVPPVASEFGELGPTLGDAADEVEEWLVDGPIGLSDTDVDDLRAELERSARNFTSDGAIVDGAIVAAELLAGAVLTLVIAFFLVKDGSSLQEWVLDRTPPARRDRLRRAAAAAWSTLSRYVLAAAMLGLIEAIILGTTLALTGSSVVVPVAVLTFVAAFFPFVGAIVASTIAVIVALVSSGFEAALVVGLVALAVQQFDNDLLAPLVYSRALHLHPLAVILAVATGASIAGFLGAFLAVPLAAVVTSVYLAATDDRAEM